MNKTCSCSIIYHLSVGYTHKIIELQLISELGKYYSVFVFGNTLKRVLVMFGRTKNAFQILGVEENCTDEQVKDAYMSLAKQWHPDLNKSTDSTEKFQSISHAFEQVKSETARMHYRSQLQALQYSSISKQWQTRASDMNNDADFGKDCEDLFPLSFYDTRLFS